MIYIIIFLSLVFFAFWFKGLSRANKGIVTRASIDGVKYVSVFSFTGSRDTIKYAATTGAAASKYSEESLQTAFDAVHTNNTNVKAAGGSVKVAVKHVRAIEDFTGINDAHKSMQDYLSAP